MLTFEKPGPDGFREVPGRKNRPTYIIKKDAINPKRAIQPKSIERKRATSDISVDFIKMDF